MNIQELKRRLQPYSGFLKPTEEGGGDSGGAAGATSGEEVLDLGNDAEPETGSPGNGAPAAATPAPAPALQACQHNHYICLLNGLSPFGIELRLLFLLRRNKLYRRLFLLYLFSIYQEAILRYLHNRDKLLIASYYLQWHTP